MPSRRSLELTQRLEEFERTIAAFEGMNGNLRLRRTGASPEIREFCDRHIEQNTRTIETMRHSVAYLKREIQSESCSPFPKRE